VILFINGNLIETSRKAEINAKVYEDNLMIMELGLARTQ
jgi:hypothetical protein